MDKLKAMQIFVKVVDKKSLTVAAQNSNLSVSMVSNYLKYLEEDLGTALVARTTRNLSITDFGTYYYGVCQNVLAMIRESGEVASNFSVNPEGTLNLTAPRTFGVAALLPRLGEFYAQYPKIRVDVSISDDIVDMTTTDYDAAIRLGPLSDSNLVARPLRPYSVVLCTSPDYLAGHPPPSTPGDLARHPCIATYFDHKTVWNRLQTTWEFIGGDGAIHKVDVPFKMQVNDAQGACALVLKGAGIALIPELLAQPWLQSGQLVRLLPDYRVPDRAMHLVYRKMDHMPSTLKALVKFLLDEFS
ncbi:LysR family transcriptional regulator [Duganella sp. BJB488]|uniref:LysR family transcriptional regulator n=1 Tax=unclassified Duganella TaxID=2636909 RepID=UPI000E351BE4|nr:MULTISPECIES: LysR family transcriptional regulator [unclassified Duganella]NVD72893.1 LysR family transcriptional regulator [Duganella sp. BJB1802]RFP11725.1 LysR family transcriptional regulator [Duganella sp. BJB489]RFP15561.1 LysR family transcriptional regulator [Duganella sp. BJB488]RFP30509.1 LysR family transcriptional regulator [Duganella sp. BJB480]